MSKLTERITLRPWPRAAAVDGEELRTTLDRIYAQKGHFRHITEESLEKEIQDEADEDAKSDAFEEDSVEEASKKEAEAFNKAKADMIKHVGIAHNSAYQALDFVSLLLSKEAPQRANISLSPFMKQKVPQGILTYDQWPSAPPSQPQQEAQVVAARGWRMKSLASAADKLSDSAIRLEKELKRETSYWEQVLSVTEKGWSVRKVDPERNRHTLGVQFGSLDAGAQFRSRGFAALETDDDGAVVLNQHLTRTPKALRVRVVVNSSLCGCSDIQTISQKEAPIDVLIHRARDSLFDEELYHEMLLETRQLQAYGVRAQENMIRVPLSAQGVSANGDSTTEFLIDLVPLSTNLNTEKYDQDQLAEYIATALRILLSHAYRRRQQKRTQIPPPLSDEPRKHPPSVILRPLLNHLRHKLVMEEVRTYLKKTCTAFQAAKLYLEVEMLHDTITNDLSKTASSQEVLDIPLESLVSTLSSPVVASITIKLPSSSKMALKVEIRTYFAPPDFGTTYTLHLEPSIVSLIFYDSATEGAPNAKNQTFTSVADLIDFVDDTLKTDLLRNVISSEYPGWTIKDKEGFASRIVNGRLQKVGVRLRNGNLQLATGEKDLRVQQTWDGSAAGKSFREVIEGITKN